MFEIKRKEGGEDREVTLIKRDVRGSDIQTLSLGEGQTAHIELNEASTLVIQVGPEKEKATLDVATAPMSLIEEGGASSDTGLKDGSEDELRAIIGQLKEDPSAEKTGDGKLELAYVNSALEVQGFKPVNAKMRDKLSA